MTEAVLDGVKVGDKLCVWARFDANRIEVVERVTPTGRVITKSGVFGRDGYLRGDTSSWHRTRARLATEDDFAGIHRARLVRKIKNFHRWDALTPDDLKAVASLVERYNPEGKES